MKELLKDKFETGLSVEQLEENLGENRDLHDHHFKRSDVSPYLERVADIGHLKILVITEPWCADSLVLVPTLLKLFADNDNVEFRFVWRDKNMDLMEHYLTNGGAAMPKFIVMDGYYNELFNWGPRPKAAQDIFEDHRQEIKDGKIEKIEVTKKIRAFYARNRGQAILDEFTSLLTDALQ